MTVTLQARQDPDIPVLNRGLAMQQLRDAGEKKNMTVTVLENHTDDDILELGNATLVGEIRAPGCGK